jgi:hydroxymethylpyrimidine/phosphomethylpyrimidine kinase
MVAMALTIAGSDSGGGAGIQADLKTFSALGVYGASAITALTAQNTLGVQGVMPVPPQFVGQQIDSVLGDLAIGAIKIGMLADAGIINEVARALARHPARPVVLDPVMIATSGDALLRDDAIAALMDELLPLADIVTPNLHEAARMTGLPMAADESAMQVQAAALIRRGARAVLIKGGHGAGPEAVDLFVTSTGTTRLATPRIDTRNTHGTGCTLSSAIAAGLAKGLAMEDAISAAKAHVTAGIAAAQNQNIGQGAGPLHHFHTWW